jgi:hypothetical protein
MRKLLIVMVVTVLSGCAQLPPAASGTVASDFPVAVESRQSSNPTAVKLSDLRPIEQRQFEEKPTATGRYAMLGDGAISPDPVQLIKNVLAASKFDGSREVVANLHTFRIEVVFRVPERGFSAAPAIAPVAIGGGKLLFIPSNYFSGGTWLATMSSVDVALHVEAAGRDHIVKLSVPFERRLTPSDIATTVNLAIDQLQRSISN